MIVHSENLPISQSTTDGVSTLYGISWQDFKDFEQKLRKSGNRVKLSYLQGVLEIVSPIGPEHENVKRTLNLLLEAYMREKGIRFYACGGFTIEAPQTASSIPDDSYCIGTRKKLPDIVIEVIITSGSLDKTELYRPLKIPEVWFWKQSEIFIYQLQGDVYERVNRSQFLPELEPLRLISYLNYADQYDAVEDFTNEVRNGNI